MRSFGGSTFDAADSVAIDSQGNVLISASVSAAIDLGNGATSFGGDHDVLIAEMCALPEMPEA